MSLEDQITEIVSFSVDATHIDRLGRELVARQDTALAELIKNAYDADATQLMVTFYPKGKHSPSRIEIEDNGNGMTRQALLDGFMRISTSDKVLNPTSPRFARLRAGRKGIGRFAAQRLARKLTVITKSRLYPNEPALRLDFDWDTYVAERNIQDIPVPLRQVASASFGTHLILEDVRDEWSEDEVKAVADSLAPLIQPPSIDKGDADDPTAFEFTFVGPTGVTYTPEDAFAALSKQALAYVEASIDDNGSAIAKISSERIPDAAETIALDPDPHPLLAGVTLRAYYFILGKEWLPAAREDGRTVRDSLRRSGGIRIYRNGFRVMPYGEPSFDWLQLDAEYRKRSALLAPIGNQNFIGAVHITDPAGERFQETSSREGLIENAAFRDLCRFAFHACYEVARRISVVRAAAAEKAVKEASVEMRADVVDLEDTLSKLKGATSNAERDAFASSIVSLGRNILQNAVELDQNRINENNLLRVLSTLGMTVAEFVHEVRGTISYANGDLSELLNGSFAEPTKSRLARLRLNLSVLSKYADYFSAVITSNEKLAVRPVRIDGVLITFTDFASAILEPKSIKLDAKVEGYGVSSKPMHDAEWLSILSNLLSNSVKAISVAHVAEGKIMVRAAKAGNYVLLRFADNGIGIPRENWDRVFEPFFTTTRIDLPRARENADEASGMGLGLKIVRDIAESNEGSVSVVDPPAGFSTCIEVRVPGSWVEK